MSRPTTYTAADDALLAQLIAEDVPLRLILVQFPYRSEQAVKSRLRRLRERGDAAGRPGRKVAPPRVHASEQWPAEKNAKLVELWARGLSSAEIGARMGITKHAVLGRAHRMMLPSRASPIVRGMPRVPKNPTVVTRTQAAAEAMRVPSAPASRLTTVQNGHPVASPAIRAPSAPPHHFSPVRSCQYPLWADHERPTMRFCDAPVGRRGDGSPLVYCSTHHSACHGAGTRSEQVALRDAVKVAA